MYIFSFIVALDAILDHVDDALRQQQPRLSDLIHARHDEFETDNSDFFAFLVLGHGRRRLIWYAVTTHPTAEWLARQITEAFPWNAAPKYLIRDNDRVFGGAFKARVRAMGIRDRPTSFRSPWQNGHVERLIGSIRRARTDHLIVVNEEHVRRILARLITIT